VWVDRRGVESIRETFSHLHPFLNEKLGEFARALSIKYSVEGWSTSFVTVNHTKDRIFSKLHKLYKK